MSHRVIVGVVPFILVASACSASGPALLARLEECGLVSEGERGPAILRAFYLPDRCYDACLSGATCDELEATVCRTSLDLLVACDRECAFPCADGSLVAVEAACDGTPQCADRSDETGCPATIGVGCDGSIVPGRACDGRSDCWDSSDERGCGPGCASGESLFSWQYCDGYRDCRDGSDEARCPEYACASGQILTLRREAPTPRCDGNHQCWDSSDERGCATLVVSCGF